MSEHVVWLWIVAACVGFWIVFLNLMVEALT